MEKHLPSMSGSLFTRWEENWEEGNCVTGQGVWGVPLLFLPSCLGTQGTTMSDLVPFPCRVGCFEWLTSN
jgi:hypothetical protein